MIKYEQQIMLVIVTTYTTIHVHLLLVTFVHLNIIILSTQIADVVFKFGSIE